MTVRKTVSKRKLFINTSSYDSGVFNNLKEAEELGSFSTGDILLEAEVVAEYEFSPGFKKVSK